MLAPLPASIIWPGARFCARGLFGCLTVFVADKLYHTPAAARYFFIFFWTFPSVPLFLLPICL
jgi:hypothetical protein